MPWKSSEPVDQRLQFIAAMEVDPPEPLSVVCRRFGISRKTGYKWLARYNEGGPQGLLDGVSRPLHQARATPPEVVAQILEVRKAHPRWGPKKIHAVLRARSATQRWPTVSTIGAVLKRHGLIVPRRRRVRWSTPRADRPTPTGPNGTWCVDFKGDFLLGDGTRCYPLTVTDLHTRFVLTITCFARIDTEAVRAEFRRLFRLYGLPDRIRSDNGVPFATTGPGRLSLVAIEWIKLGIVLERTEPGHPEQNGAHERMHRTLKDEVTHPPRHDLAAQQVFCDAFRHTFNIERPHEALGQTTPAAHYTPSQREPPVVLPDPTYPVSYRVLRVSRDGRINRVGRTCVLLHAMLAGERVGLEPLGDQRWAVFFGPVRLGLLDATAARPRLQAIHDATLPALA